MAPPVMEVVERDVFFGQRVMIGRDVAAIHDELRIVVALGEIAKDLVVGAVLFDDEEDVLDAERGEVRDAAGVFEFGAVGGDHFARAGGELSRDRAPGMSDQRAFVLAWN